MEYHQCGDFHPNCLGGFKADQGLWKKTKHKKDLV